MVILYLTRVTLITNDSVVYIERFQMTVEFNYGIAIASTNEKQNQNQSHHVRVILTALRPSYMWLLGIATCCCCDWSE